MNGSYAFRGENFSVRIVARLIRSTMQQFELIERPKIVMALPIILDGSLLLVKQYRVAVNKTTVEFPAGRVNEGEQPDSAIRRELLEEIGFVANTLEYIGEIITAPHFCDEHIKIFFATGRIVQDPQPTCKESSLEVMSIASSALPSLIHDGSLSDAKSLAAVSLAMLSGHITG
jgi:ADP-ribose pyrophosphatase